MARITTPEETTEEQRAVPRAPRGHGLVGKLMAAAAVIVAIAVLIVALAAVNLLPRLRNPFGETTSARSGPVLLKSITALSRYQAASGSFQVGLPVLTLQKPHLRVHVSPRIMNVAVPRSQHSPTFGQAASWQTVCRFSARISSVSSR